MRLFALCLDRKLLLATAVASLLAVTSPLLAQLDPPTQGGRISYITGTVSIQPAGSDDWEQAVPNLPIGPGDRVFTDSDGQAEVQVGQTFARIGPNSDLSLVNADPDGITFGVAQGAVHVHSFGLWPGQHLFLSTPSGTSSLDYPGQLRVDVYPDDQATVFTNVGTNTMIRGAGGFFQDIGSGQAFELIGSNPVYPQWYEQAPPDDLEYFSQQRDQQLAQVASYQYVSREVPGAYELDAAGTWQPGTPYGPIWFPNQVEAGWAPYHNGHWINRNPYGWIWVENESWGYAPFHYGRWVSFNGRWGWVPGPPAAHPVWSPALVVFAGDISFGGGGVSAWFPLGPGEPYRPWYPCSPRYVDQVNITNIVEAPRVHVQTTYVNINIVNVTYVNRTYVTAMRQEDFASGRPASQAAVHIDVNVIAHAQPMAQPQLPRPSAAAMIGHPPARPVPVAAARPVLINSNGKAFAAKPGAAPVEPPVKPAPPVRALPGRQAIAPPPTARPQSIPSKPQSLAPPAKVQQSAPERPAAPSELKPAARPAPEISRPAPPPQPAVKPAPPAPAVKPAPTPERPPVKPAPETTKPVPTAPAPKPAPPAAKPTPPPAPAVKPAPMPEKPAVKPAPETAPRPGTATPPAKPGAPPAKNPKDKKDDKNKDEKDKDKRPE